MPAQTAIRAHSLEKAAAQPPHRRHQPGCTRAGTGEFMGAVMPFVRNAEIYAENEP